MDPTRICQSPANRHSIPLVAALALLFASVASTSIAAQSRQVTYLSPQDAVAALVGSVRSGDVKAILSVLGPKGRALASSGDAVADAAARERFLAAFDEAHEIRQADGGARILYLGKDDYPFPLPLVAALQGKWRFDTAAGLEEVLNRRIGENELATIEVLRAYVEAQHEYAEIDRDGKGLQYARRFLSSDGKHDGLYWPTADDEAESPLGSLIAEARAEGYKPGKPGRTPYHGYLYRILTAQSGTATGGARDYIVGGRMIGGFGLLAAPAEYGVSGIKTFMINQEGTVFEKDLGERTRRVSDRIQSFDPGEGWARVSER